MHVLFVSDNVSTNHHKKKIVSVKHDTDDCIAYKIFPVMICAYTTNYVVIISKMGNAKNVSCYTVVIIKNKQYS